MAKPLPRMLEVKRIKDITPNMRRITLGGEGMRDFPVDQESAYIKLMFPEDDGKKAIMRTYTIIKQRNGTQKQGNIQKQSNAQEQCNEIDVDFVLHGLNHCGTDFGTDGPASYWAKTTTVGDTILIGGPGAKKLINNQVDWFLLVGDMTALPAITVNLAQLPDDAVGYAVIEVISKNDIQPIKAPQKIEIHWVVNPVASASRYPLLDQVKALTWLEGAPAVWVACEFNSMRALRQYFKQEKEVAKTDLYISSYWKLDSSEDEHKIVKREDAESVL